ncbi:SLBB domain-containing protein [Ferrimonas gelatinilytica]|uniref:SLBB domain-containing protein n=1 Tax=Ferrimonas gelatinilytica TaxID=1255257 RepID=A0ABP9RUW2_9GAMM
MKKRFKRLTSLLITLPLLLSQVVHAMPAPSPEMIEQFKRLPASEQQRLARQFGIDPALINAYLGSGGGGSARSNYQEPAQPLLTPRGGPELPFFEFEQDAEPFDDGQLRPYGYELFEGEPSTYAPVSDVPVPANYVLGPGDELRIHLYGKETETHRVIINRNGSIDLPQLGPIHVAGLTFSEMRDLLKTSAKEQLIGRKANITMGELRSIRIFVAGEAYRPGSYTVSALSTASHALTMAGGLREIGSLRNIQIRRDGELVGQFDAYDLLMRGDASGDLRLQSGDVVFVPTVNATVAVEGDVRRPAIYELAGGETMADILAMAGGTLPGAYPSASVVERFNRRHQRSIVNVDLTANAGKSMRAQDGDRLQVRSSSDELDGAVTLVGAVARPGNYQWQDGMRVSNILRSLSADLTWNSDIGYALIVRERNVRGDIEVQGFDLAEAIRHPGSVEDLMLMPRDKILVFNDRDEALDRRELGKLFEELSEEQSLQASARVNTDEAAIGLDKLSERTTLAERKEVAGVAVQDDGGSDSAKAKNSEDLKYRILTALFQHDVLIEMSSQLTRRELLFPVLAKLNGQARFDQGVKVVAIDGEVANPGLYPLVEGAKVSDLIALAGGLKESAYLDQAELSRTLSNDLSGTSIHHLSIRLNELLAGDGSVDIALQSRDRLNVFAKPDWQNTPTVEIRGEVRFPGIYAIHKGETLADVITRAGGFTEYAYPYGGVFTRESVRRQEQLEIQRVVMGLRKELANRTLSEAGSYASVADTNAMLAQLEKLKATGRMVVDFNAIQAKDAEHNLIAEGGDLIYIPPMRQTIAVMGEVQHPASHRFDGRMTVKDYVKLSGGSTRRADTSRMYVVRADGSVMIPKSSFWFGGKQTLRAGDTIIMPLDTAYKDNLTLWSQVTGIIYNTAVAISALNII